MSDQQRATDQRRTTGLLRGALGAGLTAVAGSRPVRAVAARAPEPKIAS